MNELGKKKNPLATFTKVAFILSGILFLSVIFGETTGPTPKARPAAKPDTSSTRTPSDVYYMAQVFVERNLKSPTSAKFPPTSTASVMERDGMWFVASYVDSQNSFGAMIRTQWAVAMKYEGSGSWKLITIDI